MTEGSEAPSPGRIVVDRGRKPAALAHRAQDQEIADRLRHTDAGRDRMCILPARRVLLALLVFGAGAMIATEYVAKAAPDGYTVLTF